MERGKKAVEIHHKGYNCCQSVLLSCADLTDLSEQTLACLGAGFLGGMATAKGTCGALVGAQMIMGLKEFKGKQLPGNARDLCQAFENHCGAVICGDIKGKKTGKVLCPCDECIRYGAQMIEEIYG
ncbi:MAG: C_GCAxxG_C_C family protein [Eubacterium sp.]|nr:C_GCAxxG_C_C family protein [Eubacterium sp.]